MDHLKAMRIFVRVVDEASFAGAARALDVAPAAVTRAVAELEAHLGARLLVRTTRRVSLTDIGRRYLERARAILADVAEATALASAAQAEARGLVRLRTTPAFAARQLGPRLARFGARHPHVSVELTAGGPVDTIDEAHDITLLVQREPLDGGFVARRLARSELVLCGHPALLARTGRPRDPHALAAHPVLAGGARGPRRALAFAHRTSGEAVIVTPPAPALSSTSDDVNHACALAGVGLAAVPSYIAEPDVRAGRLERVLPDWRLPALAIWACLPSRKHLPASTRALLDFLVDELGGEDRDPWLEAPAPAMGSVSNETRRGPACNTAAPREAHHAAVRA